MRAAFGPRKVPAGIHDRDKIFDACVFRQGEFTDELSVSVLSLALDVDAQLRVLIRIENCPTKLAAGVRVARAHVNTNFFLNFDTLV